MRTVAVLFGLNVAFCAPAGSQPRASWRAATASELEAALPARASVQKERIETEMRTATGIINDRGNIVAAVVLITAGYSADGKYSHYLLVQAPFTLGDSLTLAPGTYVVGWKRAEDGLLVHFFEAATGAERGQVTAKPLTGTHRVESFHIWPPGDRAMIQLGRYMIPYRVSP